MTIDVFVSKPSTLAPPQQEFCDAIGRKLQREGFTIRTVGVSDFTNRTPLAKVRSVMAECSGAVILGLAQLRIVSGIGKEGTPREYAAAGVTLSTPWNQLEAGIAFMAAIPLFIVREPAVRAEGIFDASISDYFVHQSELDPAFLESAAINQPFAEWSAEVRRLDASRR